MKVGGKVMPPKLYDDEEASAIIHATMARKRLEKARTQDNWKLAAASATNRRMLIGAPRSFRPPR